MVEIRFEKPSSDDKSTFRWFLGMITATTFSVIYIAAPLYILSAILAVSFRYPTKEIAWLYAAPVLISAVIPPVTVPGIWSILRPMLDYFHYEQIHETSPINVQEEILKGKNYLCIFQPHGVISFVGICSAANAPPEFDGRMPTAVADALLRTPILKHIMGIFGLISASKKSLQRQLRKPGVEGTVVLYVGGIAELFLSSDKVESLYLKKRKGFIKLALQEGVDIVPVYLFGNTSVLSVLTTKFLANLSRKIQTALTYFYGKWYLPIPRDCKLLYVSGQPLGLPHIENPTQEDIDKWHAEYCKQVARLFEMYKERVPEYKHKKLEIV